MNEIILAGDIGGTKTILAFLERKGKKITIIKEERFSSKEYSSFNDLLIKFFAKSKYKVQKACFSIAGPIKNNVCKTTNLPWQIAASELEGIFGLEKVALINDLEAIGYAISILPETDFQQIYPLHQNVSSNPGNGVIIAAGTGLGEGILFWDGENYIPLPSEGGHADYAPTTPLEVELWRYLKNKYDHVSYERVLSGPGLYNIYRFFQENSSLPENPEVKDLLNYQDPPRIIAESALAGKCQLSQMALNLFIHIYGAEAGNLALKAKALGGVYIAGGIAPKILPKFYEETFSFSFLNKGRMNQLLQEIPVKVILNEKAALYGAANYGFNFSSLSSSI